MCILDIIVKSETTMEQHESVLTDQSVAPTFCLCFGFTGIFSRGMLHHVCDEAYDENMC